MTEITTKALIHYLPFPADFKLELLEKYDSLPQDEKIRISGLVWNLYYDLYDSKIKDNFEKGLKEAQDAGLKIDQNYFKEVVQRTNEEFNTAVTSATESTDLQAARKSMEQIVQAINAAKTSPKPQKTS